jgi:D-arabinose 1-dehydrogenase-like Zn-dependent alcohol dehydrogenase
MVELLKLFIFGICIATDIEFDPAVWVPITGAGGVGNETVNVAK